MGLMNTDQLKRAVEVMHEYLAAPKDLSTGLTPWERQTGRDRKREEIIDGELKPILQGYLSGQVSMSEFKTKTDGINKRNEFWGFKGIKGQMFFNMVVNISTNESECDAELKAALAIPVNEEMASSRIRTFTSYVRRISDQYLESGGSKAGRPKIGSIPFFLSYFWQIHDRLIWPVYYTNSVNVMMDLNIWQPSEDLASDYIQFKKIHEELGKIFSRESGRNFGHYEVEHVFWFKGGNPFGGNKPLRAEELESSEEPRPILKQADHLLRLPESFVPPVVAILPQMATNDAALIEAAKQSGLSLERAFEKHIDLAFKILGYETVLLGQGKGRVPDGRAIDPDGQYAILWDAKVRSEGYDLGRDDRAIREYVASQTRELKRTRSLRNIYYLVISGEFNDDFKESIKLLKMDTGINEVILLEASALVAMVNARLRDPRQVTLGSDGIQRLLSASGIIKADDVEENL